MLQHSRVVKSRHGLFYSDLSMLNNDWQMTQYPFVPGHEIVGEISKIGTNARSFEIGQRVGLGWFSQSCMVCQECMCGDHNLCSSAQGVIVGRHGGFADHVRADASWVVPIPNGINCKTAGPLFCGGITVFNPIIQNHVQPTDRVGVVGIGGLGHMALRFLNAWGCEVTAFSTSPDKENEARNLGAHHFVNSRSEEALSNLTGSLDLILVTVNVDLNWDAYIQALRPKGRLHVVGAANTISAAVFPLLVGQKSIGASPLGSPATTHKMLEFAARHQIEPITELFPMSQVNDAMEKLKNGKPRYRLVLEAGK